MQLSTFSDDGSLGTTHDRTDKELNDGGNITWIYNRIQARTLRLHTIHELRIGGPKFVCQDVLYMDLSFGDVSINLSINPG